MKTRLEEVNDMAMKAHTVMRHVFLARESCLTWQERSSNAKLFDRAIEDYVQLRIEKAMIEKGYVHG